MILWWKFDKEETVAIYSFDILTLYDPFKRIRPV